MKIGLIGAGRLGLCLALLIEDTGYDVLASDIRPDYVKDLNEKNIMVVNQMLTTILRKQIIYILQLIILELLVSVILFLLLLRHLH